MLQYLLIKGMIPGKLIVHTLLCDKLFLQIFYFYVCLFLRTLLPKHRNWTDLHLKEVVRLYLLQVQLVRLGYPRTQSNRVLPLILSLTLYLRMRTLYGWSSIKLWMASYWQWLLFCELPTVYFTVFFFFLVNFLQSLLNLQLKKVLFFWISGAFFYLRHFPTRLLNLPLQLLNLLVQDCRIFILVDWDGVLECDFFLRCICF